MPVELVACVDVDTALHFGCTSSSELVLSHFDQFLTFCRTARENKSQMVLPISHSIELRSRVEVVCFPVELVACVDVDTALHSGCTSRELVLSHFDQFLALRHAEC